MRFELDGNGQCRGAPCHGHRWEEFCWNGQYSIFSLRSHCAAVVNMLYRGMYCVAIGPYSLFSWLPAKGKLVRMKAQTVPYRSRRADQSKTSQRVVHPGLGQGSDSLEQGRHHANPATPRATTFVCTAHPLVNVTPIWALNSQHMVCVSVHFINRTMLGQGANNTKWKASARQEFLAWESAYCELHQSTQDRHFHVRLRREIERCAL